MDIGRTVAEDLKPKSRRLLLASLPLVVIVLLVLGFLVWGLTRPTDVEQATSLDAVYDVELPQLSPDNKLSELDEVTVNGDLYANGSVVLASSAEPESPVAGQVYYDTTLKEVRYFNGTEFVSAGAQEITVQQSAGDTIINGASLPQGLAVTDTPTFAGLSISDGLSVSSGGTGASSFTQNGVLYGNGTSELQVTSAPTSGQLLVGSTGGVPTFRTISGDVTVSGTGVTSLSVNSVGTVELQATGITAGTYGSQTDLVQLVIDADGRITGVTEFSIANLGAGDILQNGNTFGDTMTIGTNDGESLVFETAGVDRMIIDDNGLGWFMGNMAVGDTAPDSTAVLKVTGTSVGSGFGLLNGLNVVAVSPGSSNIASYNVLNVGGTTDYATSVGLASSVINNSTGTTDTAIGVGVLLENTNTGTITDAAGIRIDTATNGGGGDIVNNYGLYLQDQSGVGSSSNYNIYSAGAGYNWLQGHTAIGDYESPSPNNILTVSGTVSQPGFGISSTIFIDAAGPATAGGILNNFEVQGLQDYSSIYGITSNATLGTEGNIGEFVGVNVSMTKYGNGTIDDAYGINIRSVDPGLGGITNNYGLYVNDQSGVAAGDNYNIYSAGGGANYFGGVITAVTLGAADTDAILCRNSSNQVATCSSTFDSSVTLQDAYQNGNTIVATDVQGDIDLTISEATNFSVDMTGTGSFLVQDAGTTVLEVDSEKRVLITGSSTLIPLTGSIDPVEGFFGSVTVTGVGTLFTSEVEVGDALVINNESRTVVAVNSNTSLTVTRVFDNAGNDTTPEVLPAMLSIRNNSSLVKFAVNDRSAIISTTSARTDAESSTGLTVVVNDSGNVTTGTDETIGGQFNVVRTGATGGTINSMGVQGFAQGDSGGTSTAVGVSGQGLNADTNYGVRGVALAVATANISEATGVSGNAIGYFSSGTILQANGLKGGIGIDSTGTITDGAGLRVISAATTGSGAITNNYGIYVENQTAGGTDYGIYVADAQNYSLYLASTDGDAASGITFGADTNLYRSAASMLRTDDGLTIALDATISGGDLTLGTASSINGAIALQNSTNAFAVTITAPNQTVGSATISLPNTAGVADTFCLLTLNNCNVDTSVTLQDAYQNGNTIVATNAEGDIDLTVSEATNFSVDITGTGSFLVQDSGTAVLTVADGGATTFQNSTDTTSGFRVMDQDGGTPIFNIDTTNERVGIGTATPGALLDIAGATVGTNGSALRVLATTTNIAGVADAAIVSQLTVSPSGASTMFYGAISGTVTSSSSNVGAATLLGIGGAANYAGTGSLGAAAGVFASVSNTSTGTISQVTSLGVATTTNTGGGAVTNNYGILVQAQTAGASDYGIRIDSADTQTLWLSGDGGTASTGIAFGSTRDTNLYRSAANTLRTNDTFVADTGISINSTGAAGTVERLRVNAPNVVDNSANAIITTNAASSKGLVIQASAAQTGNLLEIQDSTGMARGYLDSNANLSVDSTVKTRNTNSASVNTNTLILQSGDALGVTSDSGDVTIDSGSATGATGAISIGETNASAINIGSSGIDTTVAGNLLSGKLGVNTATIGASELLRVNTPTTEDAAAVAIFSSATDSEKVLVIQGVVGQSANLQEWQDSTGSALAYIAWNGDLYVGSAHIDGNLQLNGHFMGFNQSGSTTVAAGAAAGTGPSVSIEGSDVAGYVSVTTGTSATTGILATITFSDSYSGGSTGPSITLTPKNGNGAAIQYFADTSNLTTFTINANDLPADATTYEYYYKVVQFDNSD